MTDHADKPNILFLFPDSHRGDWLPYPAGIFRGMGMEDLPIRMPCLREIMDNGTTFTRAVTPAPLCAPARACLAAGVRYEQCGTPSNASDFPVDRSTYYASLRACGYRVGGVGKLDLHKPTHWWGLDGWIDDLERLGFTDAIDNAGKIDAIVSGRGAPQDPYMNYLYERGLARQHIEDLSMRKGRATAPTPLPEEAYCDNWIGRNALQMLERFPRDQPWFLMVNFTGPHGPWDITRRMKEAWQDVDFPPAHRGVAGSEREVNGIRQNYAAMLENIDRNVALIVEEIKRRGEWERTLIVYASDHGELLGDEGRFGKCSPLRGSTHIPLVVSGPGVRGGVCSDALVELQDLAATFVDYAGAGVESDDSSERTAGSFADSHSLRPVLEGRMAKLRDHQRSGLDRDGRHILASWRMLVEDQFKLVVYEGSAPQLFDLSNDPWERHDVAAHHRARVDGMLARLQWPM